MTDFSQPLLLKPKNNRVGLVILVVILMLLGAWACYWYISQPSHYLYLSSRNIKSLIFTWLGVFFLPCISIYGIVQFLPGQGNLLLTHEGFEVKSLLKNLRRKYLWSDVTGFYSAPFRIGEKYQTRVCFDLVSLISSRRRKIFSRWNYAFSETELVELLNAWKENFAPNPPDVSFDPVLDLTVIDIPLTPEMPFWKRMGKRIITLIVIGICYLVWHFLFNKPNITAFNQTPAPVFQHARPYSQKIIKPVSNQQSYVAALQSIVRQHWNPPLNNSSLKATVHFNVLRNGTIIYPWIMVSSGSSAFDQSALHAVVNASPLPVFPPDIPEKSADVDFVFDYRPK